MQILKDDIREKILKSASKEFLENGFDKASMRNISEKAGISTSNLYNYFQSKEKLFYEMTDPVYFYINAVIKKLSDFRSGKHFNNEQFVNQLTEIAPKILTEMIKKYRKEILLLVECSTGTKYENYKNNLIDILEENFWENIRSEEKKSEINLKYGSLMHILASNLFQGLLEIIRLYKNDEWAENHINALMKYHIRGMIQFF